jgi:hypothetical protein
LSAYRIAIDSIWEALRLLADSTRPEGTIAENDYWVGGFATNNLSGIARVCANVAILRGIEIFADENFLYSLPTTIKLSSPDPLEDLSNNFRWVDCGKCPCDCRWEIFHVNQVVI